MGKRNQQRRAEKRRRKQRQAGTWGRSDGRAGAEVDAGVVRHGESLLPVLARRLQAVDEAVEAVFPGMTKRSVRTSNGFGWALGRAAADLADLGVGERLCVQPRAS
jgi:hypothetical protein